MSSPISEMQRQIDLLLTELYQLKEETDAKLRSLMSVQDAIGVFESRIEVHIAPLEERRDLLQQQLDECNYLRDHATTSNEESIVTEDRGVSLEPEEIVEPFDPSETPAPFLEEFTESPPLPPPRHVNQSKREMKQLHLFFAKRYHPDHSSGYSESDELMQDLNVALDESEDAVDLLLQIPWNDGWLGRDSSESLGDQWMRLTSWRVWLKEGDHRLENRLQEVRLSWNYTSFEQWEESGRASSFFTSLANRLTDEIEKLQQELEECQSELARATRRNEYDSPA